MVKPTSSSGETSERSSEVKYKGVRKRKWGKWVSEIRLPNSRERIWLGSYDTPEKAARAFDAGLYCLRGRNAKFNFPDNPPDIVGGQSLKSHEIQAVASRYANEDMASSSYNDHTPVDLHSQMMEQCTSSSSDGAVHVDSDHNNIDWSFLDMLDSNEGRSDFGLYSGLDNMGTDLYTPPTPPSTTTIMDDNVDDQNSCESYSQFLWNF